MEGIDPRWVPITPVTSQWEKVAGTQHSRTQLPLVVAWAITIHKSQGLTLDCVVVELGANDFAPGLSFVAISRVKTLKGLAIRTAFGINRLQSNTETPVKNMLREDTLRREQLGFELETYGMDLSQWQSEFDLVDNTVA